MCYFITLAARENQLNTLRQLLPLELGLLSDTGLSLLRQLPAGFDSALLVQGRAKDACSCGLYRTNDSADAPRDPAHLRRKYAKKGWCERKIARAIEQGEAAGSRSRDAAFLGLHPTVLAFLGRARVEGITIGLIIHWYSGAIDDERMRLRGTREIPVDRLPEMHDLQDTLIWVASPDC